jgi:hypothetical protein
MSSSLSFGPCDPENSLMGDFLSDMSEDGEDLFDEEEDADEWYELEAATATVIETHTLANSMEQLL